MENIFYLAQVFGVINTISVILFIAGLVFNIFVICVYISNYEYWDKKDYTFWKKLTKFSVILTIISSLFCIFVPEKETYLFMKGGEVIEEIANNDKVQETAGKTLDLLNQYLDEKLENKD